jgi:hypothetical protein
VGHLFFSTFREKNRQSKAAEDKLAVSGANTLLKGGKAKKTNKDG